MKPTARVVREGVGLLLLAAFASVGVWAQELSHVRIVRLSFTEGTVTVQRADVEEWATASVNTPIQEGFKVSTAESAFAEIEFENSSTARIGQLSQMEFTQLALLPSGGKVNRLTLQQGYATFNVIPEGDDFYEVSVGDATLRPQGKCRFRVDFEQRLLQVKVFKGSVEIASREGNGTLGKNTVLEVRPGEEQPFQISQGITKDAWDEWVEERENRVAMVRNQGAPAPYSNLVSDLLYGFMDLASYGDWVSMPGYGYGWSPYADMNWSPFTAGRWCWYPGFGYTWVSAEPWGWLPYHYGGWLYDPGFGWVWVPNSFTSWSPAVVSWYRGPGWVGWAPMSPRLGGTAGGGGNLGLNHCPQPRGCVTTVNEDTLRHGRPVLPNRRGDIDSREGRIVERPEIQPERFARLTGEPRAYGAGYRGGRIEDRAEAAATGRVLSNRPAAGTVGDRGTAPAQSGIVFDPEQRRYLNDPRQRSVPAPTSAGVPGGDVGPRGAPTSLTHAGRPGPVTNYPVPPAGGAFGDRPGVEDRNDVGGGVTSPGWRDAGGSRSGDRNTSAGSSGRSAPGWVVRPDGGSRSSSDRTTSSGGGRAGSDRGDSSGRSESGGRSSGASSGGGSSHSSSSGSSHSSGGGSGGGSSSSSHSSGGGSSSSSGGGSGGGGGSSHSSGGGGGSSSGGGSHSSGSSRH